MDGGPLQNGRWRQVTLQKGDGKSFSHELEEGGGGGHNKF